MTDNPVCKVTKITPQDIERLKSGYWFVSTNNNSFCCANCGTILEDLNIRACETGDHYCSDLCATQHVYSNKPDGGY